MGTVELMALRLEDVFEGPQVSVPPHVLTKEAIANSESITRPFLISRSGASRCVRKGGNHDL